MTEAELKEKLSRNEKEMSKARVAVYLTAQVSTIFSSICFGIWQRSYPAALVWYGTVNALWMIGELLLMRFLNNYYLFQPHTQVKVMLALSETLQEKMTLRLVEPPPEETPDVD